MKSFGREIYNGILTINDEFEEQTNRKLMFSREKYFQLEIKYMEKEFLWT